MSPSVHRKTRKQLIVRMEKDQREMLEKLMTVSNDKDMTSLVLRLLAEEAQRKGIKK